MQGIRWSLKHSTWLGGQKGFQVQGCLVELDVLCVANSSLDSLEVFSASYSTPNLLTVSVCFLWNSRRGLPFRSGSAQRRLEMPSVGRQGASQPQEGMGARGEQTNF